MFKRDDVRGGAERLRFLEKEAQKLEEQFSKGEDSIGIWAKETKDMLSSVAEGRLRGIATFLDPIVSLLGELFRRGMVGEATPFIHLVSEILREAPDASLETPSEWGLEVAGSEDTNKQQEEEKP